MPAIKFFSNIRSLSRKNILCIISAILLALFIMLANYLYCLPMRNLNITINAVGSKTGSEVCLFYVIVDDNMVLLDKFAANNWQYQGNLLAYTAGAINLNLSARRYAELAFRRSPGSGIVEVVKGGEKTRHNLYIKEGEAAQLIRYQAGHFLSSLNIVLGIFSFSMIYSLLCALQKKLTAPCWNENFSVKELMAFAGIAAAVVLAMMLNNHHPFSWWWANYPDVAVFLTSGKLFLTGLVPYKEIFDNKGPMIFFVNALGAKLWYPYGVWLLETLWSLAGFFFCYLFLQCRFSKYIAFLTTLMAVTVFAPLQGGGDVTETWSLPFIFISAYIFARALKSGCEISGLLVILCGACCAVVLLFRVNIAVLWCAAIPVLMVNHLLNRNMALLMRQTGWFIAGFAGVTAPVCLYFMAHGALGDMFDASVIFNLQYSKIQNTGLSAWFDGGFKLFSSVNFPYFRWLITIGFLYPVISLAQRGQNKGAGGGPLAFELNYFLVQALYAIVFLFAGTMSARSYPHYLIPGLPVFAVAFAYALEFFHTVSRFFESKRKSMAVVIFMLSLLCYFIWPVYLGIIQRGLVKREFNMGNMAQLAAANYIMANTPEGASYASYGPINAIHPMMHKQLRPASRFFLAGSNVSINPAHETGRKNFELFVRDIEMSRPRYFAVVSHRGAWGEFPEFTAYLQAHYTALAMFQNSHVRLYERIN